MRRLQEERARRFCRTCSGLGSVSALPPQLWIDAFADMPHITVRAYRPCPDCIGGISSCCDTAGAGVAEGGSAEEKADG